MKRKRKMKNGYETALALGLTLVVVWGLGKNTRATYTHIHEATRRQILFRGVEMGVRGGL